MNEKLPSLVLLVSSLVSAQIGINNGNLKATCDIVKRDSSVISERMIFPSMNDEEIETNNLFYNIIF